MKRTLLLILIFLPMLASADAIEIDGIYYNLNPVDEIAEVTYGNWDPITPIDGDGRYSGEIAIPESVDYEGLSYSVTSIGYYAFEHCENLNAVTIPSSVTSIYICAFRNCSNLTSITIPNSVTSIEKDAFSGCSGLISVSIPSSVTYIGESAFYGCSALTSITIPNSVSFIGSYAFQGCSGLNSFTIPDSMTFISEFVFNGCTSLVSVTLPEGLTSIGNYAFQNCSSLTSISIPSSVTSIGNHAFSGCSLTSLNIPNSITSIGDLAFRGCSSLTSLSIPSSVTFLGISPFYGCTGLTSIKVEEGNIIYDSRNNCNAIIKTDDNELITGCNNTLIPGDVSSIAFGAFSCCSGLTSVTIPNGVTSIGNDAFEGCTGLTSITIPSSVTSIGEWFTFCDCSGLNSIIVEEGNTVYDSRDNCNAIIRTADNKLIYGCNNTVIPNNVTSIGNYAFSGCSGLTSITIPNGVTSIESHAFYGCSSLTSIKIPNGVTSIERGSFQGCSGLTSITIPNNVTSIAELSFNGCSNLTSVIIGKSVTSIGYNVFSNCMSLKDFYCYAENVPETDNTAFDNSNIEDVTLYVPAALVSAYQAVEPWKNFKEIVALPAQCPMVKEGRTWVYEYHDFDEEEEFDHEEDVFDVSYTIQGDTVIGGVSYVKLMRQQDGISTYYAALREEGTAVFEIMAGKSDEYKILEFDPTKLSSMLGIYCDYTERKEVIRVNGREFVRHIYEPGDDPLFFPRLIAVEGVGFWCTGLVHGVYMELPTCPCDYEIFKACYEDGECIFTNEDFEYTDPQTNADYTYRPFVEEGKVWKVGSTLVIDNLVNLVDYYYFDGETVIKGKTCKQMMRQRYVSPDFSEYESYSEQPSLEYMGAWYEEDKKVYFCNPTDQQFKLMYDFSLEDNGTFQINDLPSVYVVGPRQTGGVKGFKGVYRDVMMLWDGEQIYNTTWLEGVGNIDGPIYSVYLGKEGHALFLMSCTVGDEVIYLNDEYEDAASPSMGARKRRIDFTHTIKIQPKTRIKREKNDACIGSSEREVARPKVKARTRNGAEESMYGEYNDQQLCINLDPLDDTYLVSITSESGKPVYEKEINAGNIVGLNINISSYVEGRYTVIVENSRESFKGEFGAQTTGIKDVRNKRSEVRNNIYNLQGQRINTLQKGLNIVNGQKVFVK